jgi:hypothetical protein
VEVPRKVIEQVIDRVVDCGVADYVVVVEDEHDPPR